MQFETYVSHGNKYEQVRDVAPCNLALMIEAISTYELPVSIYHTRWHNIPLSNFCSFDVKDKVSHPYKTKVTIVFILVF
jgi:hypothetical protein